MIKPFICGGLNVILTHVYIDIYRYDIQNKRLIKYIYIYVHIHTHLFVTCGEKILVLAAMARAAAVALREPSAFTWLRRGFTETVTAKGRLRPNLHRLDVTWQSSGVRLDFQEIMRISR